MAEPAEQLALPFPVPTDTDFDEDISTEERAHYTAKYKDLNDVKSQRLHCTACDKHLGCAAKGDGRMRTHPMLRTLVCRACHTFYNSGEFERGDDGSELYCRWCGQGGQVYCCSACPHVFCAKCIKRNLGQRMIREIESTDDWKCFKCSPRELWDLRSTCWALLRYCDLKNKLAYVTQEPDLKEKYQKECAIDDSECCKNKKRTSTPSGKKREVKEVKEIKEIKEIKEEKGDPDKNSIISKIPSGIQVKKFACVNVDNILKAGEKKPVKRPAEVLKPVPMRAPIPIAPYPKPVMPTMSSPGPGPMSKKFKIAPPGPPLILNHQMPSLLEPKKYQRNIVRPRIPILNHPSMALNPMGHGIMSPMGNTTLNNSPYNGYNNFRNTDNINLSLESLTQGLDMTALATTPGPSDMNQLNPEDDVVCTPDFPLEPLCEVTEDTNDDDVQCITPAPIAGPKPPPLLTPRPHNTLPDLTPENIVQMTDNDVTVNAHTGGLKFRVDPQTLSSNKMYRLPDGRIFAINANPNMPGGYSATIVAVSDQNSGSSITAPPHGATYAAKLSAVVPNATPLPSLTKLSGGSRKQQPNKRTNTIVSTMHKSPQGVKITKVNNNRSVDMKTPVEWYRYNLIEAVDSLGYSLTRLNRLKKEADSRFLRSRTIEEMRQLHRTLEQLLKTSTSRFQEVRDNLNRGFKDYLRKKGNQVSDDDDDVEILPEEPPAKINLDDSDDAIFIDENSVGSEAAGESADNQEESSSYPERIKAIATINTDNHDSGDLDGIKEPEDTDKTDPLAELSEEAKKDSNYKENKTAAEENTEIDNTKGAESEIIDTVAIKHSEDTQSEKKDKLVNEEEQTKAAVGVPSEKKQSVDSENVVDDSETTQMNKSSDDTDTLEKDVPNSSEIELRSPSGKEVPNPLEKEISNPSEKEVPNLSEKEVSNSSLKEVKQVNSEKHIPDSTDNDDQADEENEECILGDVLTRTGTSIDSEDVVTPEVNPDNEDSNDKKNKVNGSLGTKCDEAMEVDMPNSVAEVHSKNTDNDLQMSDEMIDNLLADDVNTDELTADLQKLTEHSLESLAETDLVASDFK